MTMCIGRWLVHESTTEWTKVPDQCDFRPMACRAIAKTLRFRDTGPSLQPGSTFAWHKGLSINSRRRWRRDPADSTFRQSLMRGLTATASMAWGSSPACGSMSAKRRTRVSPTSRATTITAGRRASRVIDPFHGRAFCQVRHFWHASSTQIGGPQRVAGPQMTLPSNRHAQGR
jgi:hypothetical protein